MIDDEEERVRKEEELDKRHLGVATEEESVEEVVEAEDKED